MHYAPIYCTEFVVLPEAKLSAKPQMSAIYAHNARVWYPISDLLHLRNDVLIGYTYMPEVKTWSFTRACKNCMHAYRNVNYAPIYPTLIDQSDELTMT